MELFKRAKQRWREKGDDLDGTKTDRIKNMRKQTRDGAEDDRKGRGE